MPSAGPVSATAITDGTHQAKLPVAKRLDAIAEGLALLVEHVTRLTDDLVYLTDGRDGQL
jgi:hypothetical protein